MKTACPASGMTSGARQVTSRSPSEARSLFPPERGGLRGRGGERPLFNCKSVREHGSEMNPEDFCQSKSTEKVSKNCPS
jgi:hypothetical protein